MGLESIAPARQGLLLALVSLPVWVAFAVVGQSARGEVLWFLTCVIALIVAAHWQLRRQKWFWLVIGVVVIAHGPLLWLNPLQDRRIPGAVLTPFVFLDYGIIYSAVVLCEKWLGRAAQSKNES